MIRRLVWLTLGAVLGVTAYRRLTALARSFSPVLRARELTRFAADVREGMDLYAARHPRPSARARTKPGGAPRAGNGRTSTDDVEDGR